MPVIPVYFPFRRIATVFDHHRLFLITVISFLFIFPLFLLPAYQESWLDPFNTLDIPNKILHPRSISQIGLMDPADPFKPRYFAEQSKVQELVKDLRQAKPVTARQMQVLPIDEKVLYFTLHREASYFHDAADFSLQYYPGLNIVCFGEQQFIIDDSTIFLFNEICQKMQAGWWNSN
jgi:hypothetical protein